MALHITTNNVPRELASWEDLPESEREDFNYVEGEDRWSPRFVSYRGEWYDTSDCDGLALDTMPGWDLYQSDSFFSGILFRWTDNFERVIVGRYCASSDV